MDQQPPEVPAPSAADADDPGTARRAFLRTFSRDAARSAGQLSGVLAALSGAPVTIGAELLGMTEGPSDAEPAPAAARVRAAGARAVVAPPADLQPWRLDGEALWVVDQRALPGAHRELRGDPLAVALSLLESLAVPFGPAVAEVALRAVALGAREAAGRDVAAARRALGWNLRLLRGARTSSGALAFVAGRMDAVVAALDPASTAAEALTRVEGEVDALLAELASACAALVAAAADTLAGRLGDAPGLLTLGTSGPLAGGGGTAISLIAELARRLPGTRAWIAETRPSLIGARIGALELARLGVPVTVIPDAAVAELARTGRLTAALVPVEGVTADGDLVGIGGTRALAAQLAGTGVPFIGAIPSPVAAVPVPVPTAAGRDLRPPLEALSADGRRVAAPAADGWAPLVDLTPASLVGGVVDEDGLRAIGGD